ncbi:MAG: hypothetical protein IJ438_00095 [Clostridia bacterium]|nr:hypothetical protein [Clostridia bacterium]
MPLKQKITQALAYRRMSKTDAARAMGMSQQASDRKLEAEAFAVKELEQMARLMGAQFVHGYEFGDGGGE